MLPRNWIILGVFISFIFIITGTLIGSWSPIYFQNDTTQDFGTTYNYISNLSTATAPLEGYLQSDKKTFSLGFLDFVIQGSYNVIVAIMSVPKIFLGIIGDFGSMYGIPKVYIDGVLILITISLVFGIIGTIFRRKT
jgi:hypothetical protein